MAKASVTQDRIQSLLRQCWDGQGAGGYVVTKSLSGFLFNGRILLAKDGELRIFSAAEDGEELECFPMEAVRSLRYTRGPFSGSVTIALQAGGSRKFDVNHREKGLEACQKALNEQLSRMIK